MRVPKVYLETTMFNAYYDVDAPENTQYAKMLFEAIDRGYYIPYTSEFTVREIENAGEEKRGNMFSLIERYNVQILETNDEIIELAEEYTKQGVVPVKYATDGLHIAVASIWDMDIIFSYNFKHIVKEKTRIMTEIINKEKGYGGIVITSPKEVFKNE